MGTNGDDGEMAVIRLNELKAMDNASLKAKFEEIELELARDAGMIKSTGKPSNAGKHREMRKVIARIKTILGQRGVKT